MTTKPPHPAEAAPIAAIPVPAHLNDKDLADLVSVFNAMLKANLLELFPEDISPAIVRAHILDHITADAKIGTARVDAKGAVEKKTDVIKRAKAVHGQVLGLVNASFPAGTLGRADYFPVDNTDPDLGDLIGALARGIAKRGRPKLPAGITVSSLEVLGHDASSALDARASTSEARSGQVRAAVPAEKRTREIRRRLREMLVRFFGYTNSALIEFGIKPRVFVGGRKKKVAGEVEIKTVEPAGE